MGNAPGLSDEQLRALDRLKRLPILAEFYLAGGAALGVLLSHRRSIDLDFFSRAPSVDLSRVKEAVSSCFDRTEVVAETDGALRLLCDGLPIDFVRYGYPPLDAPEETRLGVGVAGLRDLAAMKLSAISRRGLRRDFWDLFAILQTGLPLRACGSAYVARFGLREADLYHVLRSLTYFDDAEKDPVLPSGMDAKAWEAIKTFFRAEAPKLIAA